MAKRKRKVKGGGYAVMEICSGRGAWHSFNNKPAAERAAASIRASGCRAVVTRATHKRRR